MRLQLPSPPRVLDPAAGRWQRLALCAAAVWLACLAAPAWAATQVIGPGREAAVLGLLTPFRDGQEVVPGVVLDSVRIGASAIDLGLLDRGGQRGGLTLTPAGGAKAFAVGNVHGATAELQRAAALLAEAVDHNDHGDFFAGAPLATAQVRRADLQPTDGADPMTRGPLALASMLAWLVLALAVLAKAVRRPRVWTTVLVGIALWGLAAWVRRGLPLTPLHADDHAYLEMAVATGFDEVDGRAARLVDVYGPAWFQLQRWTVGLFSRDHDGVGRWAAAVGGLAVALAAVAARRASGRWLPALLGAAVMTWAPVAARVGHSESAVVVAQLLVAVVLWLASPPFPPRSGWLDALGVAAGLLLLCWGHPLGPLFAGGAGLCAWALAYRPRAESPAAQVGDYPALPLPDSDKRMIFNWLPGSAAVRSLLLVGGAVAAGAAWQWGARLGSLGSRLDATTASLPIPAWFWAFELWWRSDWAPTAFATAVAAFGILGLYAQRRVHGRAAAIWSTGAWLVGLSVCGAAGLVVVACVTDAVRYQAPMAALWVVTGAFAPRAADLFPDGRRFWVAGAVGIAQLVVLAQLLMGMPARATLDAQGQIYAILRRELAHERGDLTFLVPERQDGEVRHVVIDLPMGRWSAAGPTSHTLAAPEFLARCKAPREAGKDPAGSTWVVLPPACDAVDLPTVATPCAAIEPLLSAQGALRAGFVHPWGGDMARGLPGEFHTYRSDTAPWRIGPAVCPGAEPVSGVRR